MDSSKLVVAVHSTMGFVPFETLDRAPDRAALRSSPNRPHLQIV
jgi:hypothetical protein